MTRKDYELIAEALRDTQWVWISDSEYIVDIFIEKLKRENPRFDQDKFRKACYHKEI